MQQRKNAGKIPIKYARQYKNIHLLSSGVLSFILFKCFTSIISFDLYKNPTSIIIPILQIKKLRLREVK